MVATALAAALAQAAVGVDFEVPDSGEPIPLFGFAVMTGFFSVVGIVIAAALLRCSARPAERFLWTAVSLTAISFCPAPPVRGKHHHHHREIRGHDTGGLVGQTDRRVELGPWCRSVERLPVSLERLDMIGGDPVGRGHIKGVGTAKSVTRPAMTGIATARGPD
jgi:hypothetical protein